MEHAEIRNFGLFALHTSGVLWLKHSQNYRDLRLMGKIEYGFHIPTRIDRLANCYAGGRPLKSLLVGNPNTNSIESIHVNDFKGVVIAKSKEIWFKNKLDDIVALSYSEEKEIICAGLDDGTILVLDLNGTLKNEISA